MPARTLTGKSKSLSMAATPRPTPLEWSDVFEDTDAVARRSNGGAMSSGAASLHGCGSHVEHLADSVLHTRGMVVVVETLTGSNFKLELEPFDTVAMIKAKIQAQQGFPAEQQRLVLDDHLLAQDDHLLMSQGCGQVSTLRMVLHMRGGEEGPKPSREDLLEHAMCNHAIGLNALQIAEMRAEGVLQKLHEGGVTATTLPRVLSLLSQDMLMAEPPLGMGLKIAHAVLIKDAFPSPAGPLGATTIDGAAGYMQRLADMTSPSKMSAYREQTGAKGPLVLNWRPSLAAAGPPPQLVHPALGQFVEDARQLKAPTAAELDVAIELCQVLSQYYPSEDPRELALHALLEDWLQPYKIVKIRPDPNKMAKTDGAVVDSPAAPTFASLLVEVKTEVSMGDPAYQGAAYYGLFWESRKSTALYRRTACPALLLETPGPHIRVSALSWLGTRLSLVPLTPLLPTLLVTHDPDQVFAVARLLGALKRANDNLYRWYAATATTLELEEAGKPQSINRLAIIREGLPVHMLDDFDDVQALQEGSLTMLSGVQRATGRRVAVKFSRGYCENVHHTWAAAGLAPQLLSVKLLPGGYKRVVMDFLSPVDGWQSLADVGSGSDAAAAFAQATNDLKTAHQLTVVQSPTTVGRRSSRSAARVGVHGDARPANIMVRCVPTVNGASKWEVRFIDFEMSGRDGQDRYPPFLNPKAAGAKGRKFGAYLRQAHDLEMLEAACRKQIVDAATAAGAQQQVP